MAITKLFTELRFHDGNGNVATHFCYASLV